MSNFIKGNLEMLLDVIYGCPFRYIFNRNVPCITTYQPALTELQFRAVCHSCQKLPEKEMQAIFPFRQLETNSFNITFLHASI